MTKPTREQVLELAENFAKDVHYEIGAEAMATRATIALALRLYAETMGREAEPAGYGIIDPDYARVFTKARCIAWAEGYALMMHGSFTRDLDLLAVPWRDGVCEPQHLINRIEASDELRSIKPDGPSVKPHGRLVWTLTFTKFGDPRFIDIGVMTSPPPAPGYAEGLEAAAKLAEEMGKNNVGMLHPINRAEAAAIRALKKGAPDA